MQVSYHWRFSALESKQAAITCRRLLAALCHHVDIATLAREGAEQCFDGAVLCSAGCIESRCGCCRSLRRCLGGLNLSHCATCAA